MRNIDDFFNEVRLDVPEVGLPFVRKAILDSCRDFIKRTHIWKVTKIFSLGALKGEYHLGIPENTFIQDVGYVGKIIANTSNPVKYGDRTQNKRTEEDMDEESPGWREARSENADFWRWGVLSDRRTIFVYPTPGIDLADGVKCQVYLAPNQDAYEVPDIVYDEWAEAIGFGAASKLLAIPKKTWTDLETAEMRKRQFNKAVAAALRKSTTEKSRVRFRGLGDTAQRYNRWN